MKTVAKLFGVAGLLAPLGVFATPASGGGHPGAGASHSTIGCVRAAGQSARASSAVAIDPFTAFGGGNRIRVNCATSKECALLTLRDQGIAMRAKDGGTLTPEHRASLQAQLDAIQARFH